MFKILIDASFNKLTISSEEVSASDFANMEILCFPAGITPRLQEGKLTELVMLPFRYSP